jgi:hypothetical protein
MLFIERGFMVDKVAVFCDFNGVVNMPQGLFKAAGLDGCTAFPVDSSLVLDGPGLDGVSRPTMVDYSSVLVSELNGFMSAAPVLWYWLSSWRESMSNVATKMGLTFPSLNATWLPRGVGNGFKQATVSDFMVKHPDIPVIWVDDVAFKEGEDWWSGLTNVTPLLVKPETHVGLTKEHLDVMFDYVSRHVPVHVNV